MSWEDFCKVNKVGVRFQNAHISQFEQTNHDLACQGVEWCQRPHSLILTGLAGRGKTHFSYSLAREAIRKYGWGSIRWIKSKQLDDLIIKETSQYGNASHILEKFCEVPFLFLDDFGVDRATERAERDYYELIDSRWENQLITVISTNLEPEQIEKTYGARIFSRFKDFKWILFDGRDLRGGDTCH